MVSSSAVSWCIFGTVVISGYWYYTKDGRRRHGSNTRVIDSHAPERTDQRQLGNRAKRRRERGNVPGTSEPVSSDGPESSAADTKLEASGAEQLQQRKKDKSKKSTPPTASSAVEISPASARTIDHDESDEMDARNFARQMSKTQAGTTLTTPQKAGQRIRTQKQSKMNDELVQVNSAENVPSGTSSNTGADADDDLSSAASPSLEAVNQVTDASGVSDMLEAAGPGPSSLRITESTQPQREQQERKAKKAEPAETKKQRQARARREREKEVMHEAEAQRKILEEKQRRTAREAEGRPAKNGNGWTYASGLPANAWTQGKAATAPEPRPTIDEPLLDTREAASNAESPKGTDALTSGAEKIMNMIQPAKSHDVTTNGSNAQNEKAKSEVSSGASSKHWENSLPSEEEQMRMFQQQSDDTAWTTVPSNKRAKRRPAAEQTEKTAEANDAPSDFDVTI
ncbi:hypothetical protein MMC10_004150 [Thelotrema lepadinum]|nr:hypothetical protein [Thelotrema lepadinum]